MPEAALVEENAALRRQNAKLAAELAASRSENASLRNDVQYWAKHGRKALLRTTYTGADPAGLLGPATAAEPDESASGSGAQD